MTESRRVALVTGASRGLGAAIATRLGAEGCAVAVNHRNSEELANGAVEQIVNAGGTAAAFAADITDEESVDQLVGDIHNRFGSLDVVVLNATGPQPAIEVPDIAWQDVLDQMDFFVKSPTLLLKAALPGMKARGFGRFVHVSSEVVDLFPIGSAAYTCAKAAQRSLARSWAKELGPLGITVNMVSPGWIPVERHAGIEQASLDAYVSDVPLGHMGVPRDVASAIAFLCGDDASFITGANLNVNGGKTLVQ